MMMEFLHKNYVDNMNKTIDLKMMFETLGIEDIEKKA